MYNIFDAALVSAEKREFIADTEADCTE